MSVRHTASTITDDQLDALYRRLDKQSRALDRANALADGWAGDMTETTRSAAGDLFASVLELDTWEQVDAPTVARHLAAVPSKETA
jgi:hypothetical protein